MCNISSKEAIDFYEAKKGDSFVPFLVDHLSSGPVLAIELVGEDALQKWLDVLGPEDPTKARRTAPDSLRAMYGQELVTNGFHGPLTQAEVDKETNFFFPKNAELGRRAPKTTAM